MSKRTNVDGFNADELLLLYLFAKDVSYKMIPAESGMKLEKIKSIMKVMRARFNVHSVVALYRIACERKLIKQFAQPLVFRKTIDSMEWLYLN